MAKKKETKEEAFERLNKKYGAGSIKSGKDIAEKCETVPHISLGYNLATGIWGTPKGKLIMIEGEKHTGKSTLVSEIIASFQKEGLRCLYQDYEYSFDKSYARVLGVDVDELLIAQPDTLEDGYNMSIDLLESDLIDLIVVDSVNTMLPKAILEGEVGDATVAVAARLHTVGLNKIKPLLAKKNATMLLVSQYRAAIGSMSPSAGKQSGVGQAMSFMVDQIVKLSRLSTKKDDGYFINNIEFTKNKVSSPYQKHQMIYDIGSGVDVVRELMFYGKELGIISQAGAWYSHGETKLGGGINQVKEFFNDNPEYFQRIYSEVETRLKEGDN